MEETGLEITDIEELGFTNDIFDGEKHYVTLWLSAKATSPDFELMEPDKCEEWGWFEPDNPPKPLFLADKNRRKKGIFPRQ